MSSQEICDKHDKNIYIKKNERNKTLSDTVDKINHRMKSFFLLSLFFFLCVDNSRKKSISKWIHETLKTLEIAAWDQATVCVCLCMCARHVANWDAVTNVLIVNLLTNRSAQFQNTMRKSCVKSVVLKRRWSSFFYLVCIANRSSILICGNR